MKVLEFKGSPLYLIELKGQLGFINSQLVAALKLSGDGMAGFIRSYKHKFTKGIDYYVLSGEETTELKENLSQNNLSISSRGTLYVVLLEGLKKYYRLVPEKKNIEFIGLLIENEIIMNGDIENGEINNLYGKVPLTTPQLKLSEAMIEILEQLELPVILKFKYMSNILAGKQLDDDTHDKILKWLGEDGK